MKCVSCGGEIASDQERCPFCNTVNEAAIKKKRQIGWRIQKNEDLKEGILETSREYRWNKILNRTIGGMVVFLCLMIAISFGTYLILEGGMQNLHKPSNLSQILAEKYESRDYNELSALMRQYELMGNDEYQYTQISLLNSQFEDFLENRNECIERIDHKELPEDYALQSALTYGRKILEPNLARYDKITEDNQVMLEAYQEHVMVFFKACLELTAGEIEDLRGNSGAVSGRALEELTERIRERLGE